MPVLPPSDLISPPLWRLAEAGTQLYFPCTAVGIALWPLERAALLLQADGSRSRGGYNPGPSFTGGLDVLRRTRLEHSWIAHWRGAGLAGVVGAPAAALVTLSLQSSFEPLARSALAAAARAPDAEAAPDPAASALAGALAGALALPLALPARIGATLAATDWRPSKVARTGISHARALGRVELARLAARCAPWAAAELLASRGVLFGAYDALLAEQRRRRARDAGPDATPPSAAPLLAPSPLGAAAGLVERFACAQAAALAALAAGSPFSLVIARLTTNPAEGALESARRQARERGVAGLWRGAPVMALRSVAGAALLTAYGEFARR